MTELRKRMIESLQLRGMSERTQEAYVRAVRQLAQHYKKSLTWSPRKNSDSISCTSRMSRSLPAPQRPSLCGIKFLC